MPYKSVWDVKSEIDPNPSDSVMKQMVLGIACFDTFKQSTFRKKKKKKNINCALFSLHRCKDLLPQKVYICGLDECLRQCVWFSAILTIKNMFPLLFLDSLRCLAKWYWCSRQNIKWDGVCPPKPQVSCGGDWSNPCCPCTTISAMCTYQAGWCVVWSQ